MLVYAKRAPPKEPKRRSRAGRIPCGDCNTGKYADAVLYDRLYALVSSFYLYPIFFALCANSLLVKKRYEALCGDAT